MDIFYVNWASSEEGGRESLDIVDWAKPSFLRNLIKDMTGWTDSIKFYIKYNFLRLQLHDRSELDLSDETIRILNFVFSRKLW